MESWEMRRTKLATADLVISYVCVKIAVGGEIQDRFFLNNLATCPLWLFILLSVFEALTNPFLCFETEDLQFSLFEYLPSVLPNVSIHTNITLFWDGNLGDANK